MFLSTYSISSTKDFMHAWQKITRASWSTWEDLRMLLRGDPEFDEASNLILSYFEGVGVLVREGFLPIRMVALMMCGMTRYYYEKYQLIIKEGRVAMGFKRWFSETVYLYEELLSYLGEHPGLETRLGNLLLSYRLDD
jgi:hypothetical protein